jgi:hypothetical protein
MSYIGRTPTNAALTAADLADGIVSTDKIAADAVTDAKIADDVVGTEHLTANEVDTTALGADAVTGAQLADDAVNSEHYTDGSIDTAHLADGQVTTAKLATAVFTGATDIGADIADADLFLMDDGAGGTIRKTAASRIKTYAGGLTGVSTGSGNVTITDGDLIFGGAGHGVYLGVTSATAANHLDDYEEGTFTPAWYFSSGGSVAYSGQAGVYTKVGRMVSCRCYMSTSSISSPSGSASITGLPFTQKSGYEGGAAVGIAYRWATNFSTFQFRTNENSTAISVYKQAYNAEASNLGGSDFNSGSSKNVVALGFTYEV